MVDELTPERLRAVSDKIATRGGYWVLDTLAGNEPELAAPEPAMIDVLMAIYIEVRRLADLLIPDAAQ